MPGDSPEGAPSHGGRAGEGPRGLATVHVLSVAQATCWASWALLQGLSGFQNFPKVGAGILKAFRSYSVCPVCLRAVQKGHREWRGILTTLLSSISIE